MVEEKVEKPEKKKKFLTGKKKEIIFGILSFVGSFGITLLLILTFAVFIPQADINKTENEYRDAVSLLDNGNYEEAAARLKDMTYRDSNNLYCVSQAGQYFNAGDYESGIESIRSAGGSVDVRYDPNGGTTSTSREVLNLKRKWINNVPVKNGYEFLNWNLTSFSLSYNSKPYVASLNLLAAYNITNYSIRYDLNGGSLSNLVNDYNIDTPTFSLGSPVKKGYTFIGWSGTDIDGMSMNVSIEAGSTGNRTYLANYEANEYKITYDYKYDGLKEEETVLFDDNYLLKEPTREGYHFDGWYYSNQKVESGAWSIDGDITLEAHWSVLTFNINYDLDGGTNNPSNPQTIAYFEEVLLKDPERTGYLFDGWYLNNSKVDKIPEGTSSDINLVAKWIALKNVLTVSSEDINQGTVSLQSGTGYSGEEIVVKATPLDDYSFVGWFSGENLLTASLDYTFIMPPNDYSLTARFILTSLIDLGTSPDVLDAEGTLKYGLYPQTHVNDPALVANLEQEAKLEYDWVKYNNQYYYKSLSSFNSGHFDDGTDFSAGSYYWFRCEPIEWTPLGLANDTFSYCYTTKKIIDTCYFDKDTNNVDYENSRVRDWLNTDFFKSAFMLHNFYARDYDVDGLMDHCWLGSYKEYNSLGNASNRRSYLTDFARTRSDIYWVEDKVQGDTMFRHYAPYLTRTPYTDVAGTTDMRYFDQDGSMRSTYISTTMGIRPCVYIMPTKDVGEGLEG